MERVTAKAVLSFPFREIIQSRMQQHELAATDRDAFTALREDLHREAAAALQQWATEHGLSSQDWQLLPPTSQNSLLMQVNTTGYYVLQEAQNLAKAGDSPFAVDSHLSPSAQQILQAIFGKGRLTLDRSTSMSATDTVPDANLQLFLNETHRIQQEHCFCGRFTQ